MSISNPTNLHLATAAGIIIVAATAHVTILKTGGYALDTQAPLVLALAIGVIAAARAIGSGELTGRVALAASLMLFAGEAYNFAASLDRMVEAREQHQAPLKDKAEKRKQALQRLAALESGDVEATPRLRIAREALAALRQGSEGPAVKAARAELAAAQKRVDDEAANVACKRECERKKGERDAARAALDRAIAADAAARSGDMARAEAEVTAAAAEAATLNEQAVQKAKAAVEANPLPPSATPTADRIGMAPWAWDMLIAALLSFASAGLAAVLLSIGAAKPLTLAYPAAPGQLREGALNATPLATASLDAATEETNVFRQGLHAPLPERTGPTVAEFLRSRSPENEPPQPPKGGPRKRKTKPENVTAANVVTFPGGGKHPVLAALENAGGSVASNRDLAALMGVTDGEATKRRAEVAHLLIEQQVGKERRIALR